MNFLYGLLLIAISAFGQYTPKVEVGTGLQKVGDRVDVLVKVKGYGLKFKDDYNRVYVLSFKGEAAKGLENNSELSSVSIEAQLLNYNVVGSGEHGNAYVGFNLFDYKLKKNIDIDQENMQSFTVFGIRAGGEVKLGGKKDIKIFAKAAINFFDMLMKSKRLSDGQMNSQLGETFGGSYNLEAGIQFKKLKLSFGLSGIEQYAKGETYYTHTTCSEYATDYYHDDGSYAFTEYTEYCDDHYNTDYDEFHTFQKSFIQLTYEVTDKMTLFAAYVVKKFDITDQTGAITGSSNKAKYVQVGVKYRFGGKKKKNKPEVSF